jgi:hypothetical protein
LNRLFPNPIYADVDVRDEQFHLYVIKALGLFRIENFVFQLIKPLTLNCKWLFLLVATIELHSNQIWNDLRGFYSLVGVFEKFPNPKKAGY